MGEETHCRVIFGRELNILSLFLSVFRGFCKGVRAGASNFAKLKALPQPLRGSSLWEGALGRAVSPKPPLLTCGALGEHALPKAFLSEEGGA
jgi:hypothetical protein